MNAIYCPRNIKKLSHTRQAGWVVGVLSLLIEVVGVDSLLGMILGQAKGEIEVLLNQDQGVAGRIPDLDEDFEIRHAA